MTLVKWNNAANVSLAGKLDKESIPDLCVSVRVGGHHIRYITKQKPHHSFIIALSFY